MVEHSRSSAPRGDASGRPSEDGRTLGLLAATGIGVGAMVGGGILALAGVAFATTGPSAVLAFALNGAIALLTALSFAELASRFPRSGGTYAYARTVLTIEAAFAVGWLVWFASVVAAVLYALGFAVFLVPILEQLLRMLGVQPAPWLGGRLALLAYALGALSLYTWHLVRAHAGAAQWATVGKVVVFSVLIGGGVWGFLSDPPSAGQLTTRFLPFFENGASGLIQAMGYTFIALQGFDLIAAVGGEVRRPEKNIPRAMLLSLAAALAIYVPLLLLIVAVGSPDQPVSALAAADEEILVATAARFMLGPAGYWLVVIAGVLSMLSALQANVLAAAHVARTMAEDRTLPPIFEGSPGERNGAAAIRITAATIAVVLVAVPNVAGAGAASSLIFLLTFGLVHGIAYLARKRAAHPSPFRTRAFPMVPVIGGASCLALALYQSLAVPSAGVLAALWLGLGAILYVTQLAPGARAVDASSEGMDPQLIRLRGRTPLVLVPIANPDSAATLVQVARALAPRGVWRIRLLTVVPPRVAASHGRSTPPLVDAQRILGGALSTAIASDLRPEALVTVSDDPWSEITRMAVRSRCETLLLGVGELGRNLMAGPLEELVAGVPADVVILRAPVDWSPDRVHTILVPSRGGAEQSPVRARLLGSLGRERPRDVTFLGVVPPGVAPERVRRSERALQRLVRNEAPGRGRAVVARARDVVGEVVAQSAECDLIILGLQPRHGGGRVFGRRMLDIAEATSCPLLLISHRA